MPLANFSSLLVENLNTIEPRRYVAVRLQFSEKDRSRRESRVRIRVPRRATFAVALVLAVLTSCSYYVFTGHRRLSALTGSAAIRIDSADVQRSTDPQALLDVADHFYWLNNGTAAGPLYARAEKLFSEKGD